MSYSLDIHKYCLTGQFIVAKTDPYYPFCAGDAFMMQVIEIFTHTWSSVVVVFIRASLCTVVQYLHLNHRVTPELHCTTIK